jgi:hypothetical protein
VRLGTDPVCPGFEERTVDQLDKYAAVLNGLDRVGDINQLEGGSIEIS